jgi:hypothetical protein
MESNLVIRIGWAGPGLTQSLPDDRAALWLDGLDGYFGYSGASIGKLCAEMTV